MTVLTPNPASLRFYRTEKASRGHLLQESMTKGNMNRAMYGILKMVEYKVQIITFSQIFRNFYTYNCQLCRMPKPLMVKDTDVVGIYCPF